MRKQNPVWFHDRFFMILSGHDSVSCRKTDNFIQWSQWSQWSFLRRARFVPPSLPMRTRRDDRIAPARHLASGFGLLAAPSPGKGRRAKPTRWRPSLRPLVRAAPLTQFKAISGYFGLFRHFLFRRPRASPPASRRNHRLSD